MRKVLNEQFMPVNGTASSPAYKSNDALLDIASMTTLLEESNSTLKTMGVDMERNDSMRDVFNDDSTSRMYIESLAEGLEGEDLKSFIQLSENMVDAIVGRGWYSNRGTMQALMEDNNSVGFLPKAKVIFPMFRFAWPRLHVKEITTVVPMDGPETVRVRYFAA